MRDLRTELERLGGRARPAPDAFERLERARRRKERNRRIDAGAVAFVVAIAGSLTAFAVFRDTEARVAGEGGAESFLAIWPESSYEDALAVQEAVDAGDQSLAWRLDAGGTALAFAHDALGWTDAEAEPPTVDADGARVVVRATGCPPGGYLEQPACPFPRDATIGLQQLGDTNSIWSVVSARSEQFSEMPAPGAEIAAGADLVISEGFPRNSGPFHVSFVGLGVCAGWEQDLITPPGEIALTVPALLDDHPDGCPVALLVLRNLADHPIAGIGQHLLEYGLRTALYHVLAVPLRIVPQPVPPTALETATVTCDGANITVDTSIVRAQADGVHLRLTTTNGTFSITEDPGSGVTNSDAPVSSGEGFGTEPGSDTILANVAPARYLLTCSETSDVGGADAVGTAPLDVIDPAGHYVPSEPECSGEAYGMAPGYEEGTLGDQGDPVDVARARLTGLEEDDIVERAAYAESAAEPVVRIVRDGIVVGRVQLFDDGQGGWLLSSLDGCGETQFGWSTETTGVSGPVGEPGTVLLDLCGPVLVAEGNSIHSGTDLHVDGQDIDFDTSCLMAPAGERLTISFSNLDVAVQRNISVYTMTPCLRERLVTGVTVSCGNVENDLPIFSGEIIVGVSEIEYELEPLDPGYYYFQDDVHPAANGVLVVE